MNFAMAHRSWLSRRRMMRSRRAYASGSASQLIFHRIQVVLECLRRSCIERYSHKFAHGFTPVRSRGLLPLRGEPAGAI